MSSENIKKENVYINLLKLLFSIFILTTHTAVLFQFDLFLGGAIYVEWFYIFSGYMIARTICSLEGKVPVFETSSKIVFKKIASIFPYYLLSCITALIIYQHIKYFTIETTWHVYQIFHEIFMLQMTSLPIIPLTGTGWYLSSLWIALIILVPIMVITRKKFVYFFAVIIAIAIYVYIYNTSGYLYTPEEWTGLGYKGNIRAIADICIGCFSYAVGTGMKSFIDRHKAITFIFSLLFYILVFVYATYVENSIWYFIFPFVFAFTLPMSLQGFLLSRNRVSKFLGKLSMVLYMNHYYVANVMTTLDLPYETHEKYVICLAVSLSISIVILLLGDFIRFIYRKLIM